MWENDRNHPEDDQVYSWKDPEPEDVPDHWTQLEDYEYQPSYLIRVEEIKFGVDKSTSEEEKWCPYFQIGTQEFKLQPSHTEGHAQWCIDMLKIAFNKLTI